MIVNINDSQININQSNNYYEILREFSNDIDLNIFENILYIPKGRYLINFPEFINDLNTIEIKSKIIFEPGAVWVIRSANYNIHDNSNENWGPSSFSRLSLLLNNFFRRRFIKNVILISGEIHAPKEQIFDIIIYPIHLRAYQTTLTETNVIYGSTTISDSANILSLEQDLNELELSASATIPYHTSPGIVRFNRNSPNRILYPEWWGAGVQKNKYFYRWIYQINPPRWIARNSTPDTQAIQACLLGAYPPLTNGAERQIIKFEGSYEVTQVDLVPGLHYEGFGSVLSKPSRRLAVELSEDASEDEIELLLMDLVAAYTRHISASRLFNTKELRTSKRQGSLTLHYKSTNEGGNEEEDPGIEELERLLPPNININENPLFSLYSFVLMDRGLTRLEALRVIAAKFYESYNFHVSYQDRHNSQSDESELLITQSNQLIPFLNEALRKLTMHQQNENLHRAKDLFNLPGFMPRESDTIFSTDYYMPYLWVSDQEKVDAITISNFHFDGNSEQQGEIQFFELEESGCIKLNCNDPPPLRVETGVQTILRFIPFNFLDAFHRVQDPIRLKVDIKNCIFLNSPGDGIQCVKNISGVWSNNIFVNCFRSGIAWVGGGNKIIVENLKSEGNRYKTGIDVETNYDSMIRETNSVLEFNLPMQENIDNEEYISLLNSLGIHRTIRKDDNDNEIVWYSFNYSRKNELTFKNMWIKNNFQIQIKEINRLLLKYISWISYERLLNSNHNPSVITRDDLNNPSHSYHRQDYSNYFSEIKIENMLLQQGPWLLSAPESLCIFNNCIFSISEYDSSFNASARSAGLNTVKGEKINFENCQFQIKPQFLLESLVRDEEVAPLELGLVRATSSGSSSFPDKAIHEYFALGLSATDFNAEIVLRGCKFLVQDIEKIRQRYEEDAQEKKIRFSIPEPIEKKLNLKSIVGAVGLVESQHQLNLQMEGCYISEDYTAGFWIANAQAGKIDVSNSVIEAAIGVLSYDQNSAASNLFLTTTLKNTSFHKTKYNFILFEIHQKQYVIQSLITQAEHAAILTTNENRSLVNEIHEEENLWGRFIFGHHSPRDYATLVHAIEGDTYRLINPQLSSRNPNIVEWVYRHGEWVPQVALPYQRRR